MVFRKEYVTIFLIMVTEVLGFSLILPFLPFYMLDIGATPFQIGLIFTSFSLFQFISAPIMGKLSDSFGRKPLLIISQISTLISFVVLGYATTIGAILFSRVIDGLLGSNNTISNAYLSDISSKEERSIALGIGGAAFGVGFLIGPAIGGILARDGIHIPALLAAGLSLLSIFMTIFLLKETIPPQKRKKFSIDEVKIIRVSHFKKYFYQIPTGNLLFSLFFYFFATVLLISTFSLFGKIDYNLTTTQAGYLFAYVGVVTMIVRFFFVKIFSNKFGEEQTGNIGYALMFLCFVIILGANSIGLFVLAVTLFAAGTSFVNPILLGNISKSVGQEEQGAVMGVSDSLNSFAQIFAPALGGLLINNYQSDALMVATLIICIISGLFWVLKMKTSFVSIVR